MKSSLIDAGPIIALFDNSDQHHQSVLQFLKNYKGRLITTWPVLTEVCYMLDFNIQAQLDFLDWVIEGGVEICHLEQWQLTGVSEKMEKYSDLPADFADATLIEAAESKNLTSIITIDNALNAKHKIRNLEVLNPNALNPKSEARNPESRNVHP